MKLTKVRVENFRCLNELELKVDSYTALVGANGAGKSTVLYALDWFFNGESLAESDLSWGAGNASGYAEQIAGEEESSDDLGIAEISVEVEFDDLTERDMAILGKYAGVSPFRLRKVCRVGEKPKLLGRSRQGPGFAPIRQAANATDAKALYSSLAVEGLPAWSNFAAAKGALDEWESDPDNAESLLVVEAEDESHFAGWHGSSKLSRLFEYYLVPASVDLGAQAGIDGQGSVLSRLLGKVVKGAAIRAHAQWAENNLAVIEQLRSLVEKEAKTAALPHETRINQYFDQIVPGGSVVLPTPEIELPQPKIGPVRALVKTGSKETELALQGHGVQRAVLISMMQALVGSAEVVTDTEESASVPMMLAIEEPEIFQHPLRAQLLARLLSDLAQNAGSQVLVATHSPSFVSPAQLPALRRMRKVGDATQVDSTTIDEVVASSGKSRSQVLKFLEKELPGEFSEAFFADAVLLVEGPGDKAILEQLGLLIGMPLDQVGLAVIAVHGKERFDLPFHVLHSIGIRVHLVCDGDFGSAEARYPIDNDCVDDGNAGKREENARSSRSQTEKLIQLAGDPSTHSFGGGTIFGERLTIFNRDIEEELRHWPSFVKAFPGNVDDRTQSSKLAHVYRSAVMESDPSDVPPNLVGLIEHVVQFATNSGNESTVDLELIE